MINFSSIRFSSNTGQIRDTYPPQPGVPGGVNTSKTKFSGNDAFVKSGVRFGNEETIPTETAQPLAVERTFIVETLPKRVQEFFTDWQMGGTPTNNGPAKKPTETGQSNWFIG